jgi:ATP-dependent DNA helicase RecQ
MAQRLEAMKKFAFEDYTCRVQTMLKYFGEKSEPCGTCDVCRERRKREANRRPATVAPEVVAEAIMFTVNNNPEGITVYDVAMQLGMAPNDLFAPIRSLIDLGKLRITNNLLQSL